MAETNGLLNRRPSQGGPQVRILLPPQLFNLITMSEVKVYQSKGIGFCGILFFIFLFLKLTHFIDWSWWWVTAPLWGGLALGLAIVLIGLLLTIIMTIIGALASR